MDYSLLTAINEINSCASDTLAAGNYIGSDGNVYDDEFVFIGHK